MVIFGMIFYLYLLLFKRIKLYVICLFVGDDSELSDLGVDMFLIFMRGSFFLDYMDLDEFFFV